MTPYLIVQQQLRAALARIDVLQGQNAVLRDALSSAIEHGMAPSMQRLLALVAAEWDVSADLILSARRPAWIVEPRQVVMWISAQHLQHSLPRIGSALRRDHTSVLHGVRVVTARRNRDPDFAARVDRVVAAVITPVSPEVQ